MSVLDRADQLSDRVEDRLTGSRAHDLAEKLDQKLDVEGEPVTRATEAVEDRIRPAKHRARAKIDRAGDELADEAPEYAERLRETGAEYAERLRENAPEYAEWVRENAPEYAERLREGGREAMERVVEQIDDLDEETIRSWGPRLWAASIGFVVGFLLGWLVAKRRDEEDESYVYAASPQQRGTVGPAASSGGAKPSTPMPRSSAGDGDGGPQG